MSYYLGVDLGTSYFKAGVFDQNGNLKGLGRCYVSKETGDGRRCELLIATFWQTIRACISEAIQNAGISSKDIRTVSYSSQTNSFVLLDKFDVPLIPIVLWPDKRVAELSPAMREMTTHPDFMTISGQGITPDIHSLIAKVEWFQKHDTQLWTNVKSIMSISDYLIFCTTSQRVGDYSTASMTGLFNIGQKDWNSDALRIFNLDKSYLSSLVRTGSKIGNVTPQGATLIGLSVGTEFFAGAFDHHMVAIGAGLQHNNYLSESTGTVLAVVGHGKNYKPKLSVNYAQGIKEGWYFQMAFNRNGAEALEWFQKKYAPEYSIAELLEMAAKVEQGCNGLIARPLANSYDGLSGFDNINESHTKGHFVRAILESTSRSLCELVATLDSSDQAGVVVPSGGGARSGLWIEIKSEMSGKKFLKPTCSELACQGAAMNGAIGVAMPEEEDLIVEKWVQSDEYIDHKN